jgi:hypothetical protein
MYCEAGAHVHIIHSGQSPAYYRKSIDALRKSMDSEGEFGLQFYAAAPLVTSRGFRLGTICLLDKNKRYLNTDQQEQLKLMADIVIDEMEIRLQALELAKELNHVSKAS